MDRDLKGPPLCGVCSDTFETGDTVRRLPCRHAFHSSCIDPWLTKKCARCPLCRTNCTPGEMRSPVSRLNRTTGVLSPSDSLEGRILSTGRLDNTAVII
ncbi:hypothetical protein BJ085DRAFT_20305 [Dimargaris cristalligena]|uniref:RING-type domain-containing protein n=1 Tax=Dimargaris cristalligena TaxID=215637 RepID=A0A4P9ZWY6_9FUNG|nr:hypothetical protein BJ085DRAFT_20305 [Dimargaris cristalligena]|eukprot:RKP37210.1 hypothetical protein BJ085DRAFT_20305 [Dimargaris cristalligena]